MSIYAIMAFNSAVGQAQKFDNQAQAVKAKSVETAQAQEQLNLDKQLNQAKIKQARNEGMMSDYIGNSLEKKLNETHKAKADQLDAIAGLQDIEEHKAQTQAVQAKTFAEKLYQADPVIQAHAQNLSGIMAARNKVSQGAEDPNAKMSMAPTLPSIPGIQPEQAQPEVAEAPKAVAQPEQPVQQAPVASGSTETNDNGIDLSPIEKTFGMPKGSMWLNPSTMKPEISPIWKSRVERQQAAQATYDVNQPFRETQRQDKLEQRATQLITKAVQNRSGGVGLQDNKVNAAIHARELVNQAYNPETGEYDVTQVPYGELAESLGSLLSGGTGSSEGRINALKQRTAQGDLNGVLSYVSGKPSNATSQEALKQLVHMIDRQGQVSEELRDGYLEDLKKLPVFNELEPERAQALLDTNIGASFKEHLQRAPDKQGKSTMTKEKQADYSNLWK